MKFLIKFGNSINSKLKYLSIVLCRSEPSKTHYREMQISFPTAPDRVNQEHHPEGKKICTKLTISFWLKYSFPSIYKCLILQFDGCLKFLVFVNLLVSPLKPVKICAADPPCQISVARPHSFCTLPLGQPCCRAQSTTQCSPGNHEMAYQDTPPAPHTHNIASHNIAIQ